LDDFTGKLLKIRATIFTRAGRDICRKEEVAVASERFELGAQPTQRDQDGFRR
jgi:hypothetical protein